LIATEKDIWIRFPSDMPVADRARALVGWSTTPADRWTRVPFIHGAELEKMAFEGCKIFSAAGYAIDAPAFNFPATTTPTKENTTMATPTPTNRTSRPSTASRVAHALKQAAIGKAVTEAEQAIVDIAKNKIRALGYKDLPDHPIYDKLLLGALAMSAMELAERYPDTVPGSAYVWEGADAALHFQAAREADAIGSMIVDVVKDLTPLFGMLGSSVKSIATQYDTTNASRERDVSRMDERSHERD
jgi:hypothetical protein